MYFTGWHTHYTQYSVFHKHFCNPQEDSYGFSVAECDARHPSLLSPDGCGTDCDKLPVQFHLIQSFTVQETKAEAKGRKQKDWEIQPRAKTRRERERGRCACVWMIILTLFFPLTVHFSTSFVFQVSFWKMNRQPTVSSKTSCFSPSQLLLHPIVQVLLRDSCDENLINFNKLLWRETNKQRKN